MFENIKSSENKKRYDIVYVEQFLFGKDRPHSVRLLCVKPIEEATAKLLVESAFDNKKAWKDTNGGAKSYRWPSNTSVTCLITEQGTAMPTKTRKPKPEPQENNDNEPIQEP